MKHIYTISAIFLMLASLAGCDRYQAEDLLLPRTDISLTIKGVEIMSFDEQTCQLGHNPEKNEFRIVNDKLRDWVIFRCDADPATAGQKVTAYLEYTTADDVKRLDGLSFSVEKTSEEGLIWLWNDDKKIGIVIKSLILKL